VVARLLLDTCKKEKPADEENFTQKPVVYVLCLYYLFDS
jgi:hypothetical protein